MRDAPAVASEPAQLEVGAEPATVCSSCGAPIVWALTPAGKRMPFDAEPLEVRGLYLIDTRSRNASTLETPYPIHRTHFATCPHAQRHRKRKND